MSINLRNPPSRPEYLVTYNVRSERRVAVLDKVTDFLLFLGKLLIVGIVGRKPLQELKMCSIFL